ncbi:MAG: GntR family transcriptional regulator [Chloroflexi bacterium]|nr:GntR family transcriptional regulator [Chloroflexota bacterium]
MENAQGEGGLIVKRTSLVEEATRLLRDAILRGYLPPGKRLVQEKLAVEMGISKTPLREALAKLENEGLVSSLPQGGIQVTLPSMEDALHTYEVREVVDGLAARRASRLITTGELDSLRRYLDIMPKYAENQDWPSWLRANQAFHELIAHASQNTCIIRLLPVIRMQIYIFYPMMQTYPDIPHSSQPEHEEILAAIAGHDGATAEALARQHTARIKTLYLNTMSRGEQAETL